MRQQRRDPADRAGLSFDVEQRKIAFRRGVEFEDLRNRETRLRTPPRCRRAIRCRRPAAAGVRLSSPDGGAFSR